MLDINQVLSKSEYSFDDLVSIMKILRDREVGCPWDVEQTHKSIRNNFIEEVYEAVEAIDNNDDELLEEELGDVLLQVVFHSEIAESEGRFNINDVSDGICKKLILRHPHVFRDINVKNSEEVLENWEAIKRREKAQKTLKKALDDVARSLPSLMRSFKLRKKAEKDKKIRLNYSESANTINKLLAEIGDKLSDGREVNSDEIGQVLMAVTDISYICGIDPEQALYDRCENFIDSID